MDSKNVFVAVHAGAGFHSKTKEEEYADTCREACRRALAILKDGGTADDAVAEAVAVLEDAPCTNAGLGSSLTMEGEVECDASLMEGRTLLFGAVGAIRGQANPVRVAHALTKAQMKGSLSCGRIPPSVLVGEGARQWAHSHGMKGVEPGSLITESSRQSYLKYKKMVEKAELGEPPLRKKQKVSDAKEEETTLVQDTVGAVCLDHHGNLAAAASSGGIWLKHPGRLGPAAMFGAGCWACNQGVMADRPDGVAVAATGSGEHVMRTLLAKTCAEYIQTADDTNTAIKKSFDDHFGGLVAGGVLAISHSLQDKTIVELIWSHTTDSMVVGYASGTSQQPRAYVSRMSTNTKNNVTFGGRSFCF